MQPNTSLAALSPRSPWAFLCSCLCAYYTIFGNFWVTLLRTELLEEVHLQGSGELRRRSEGYVDVLVKHLRDVRTRHLHALRKLSLRHSQLLHPQQNAAEEGTDQVIGSFRLHA